MKILITFLGLLLAILPSLEAQTIAWVSRNSATSEYLRAVAWNGSQFVVVGDGAKILTSTDGIAWTARNAGLSNTFALRGLVWNGSQFVALGQAGTIITSPDGVNWTTRSSGTGYWLFDVNWNGSQFVAVGEAGTILTSSNGISWSARASGTTNQLMAIAWDGNQYVAVATGGTIVASADGISWASRTSGTTRELDDIVWTGNQFVVVGERGIVLTSSNGTVWTARNSGVSSPISGVTWNGSQLVAVGFSGVLLSSADGVTWLGLVSGTTNELCGVAWTGTQYVVIGGPGTILTGSVPTAPAITTQPVAQSVVAGENVIFTVVATGGALSYQWRKDGVPLAGATSGSYVLSGVQSANAGSYTVVVTNGAGSVTSSAAILTVNSSPVITTQPQSQSVAPGSAVSLSVVASGSGLGYQWQLNGSNIPGATAATLTLSNVQAASAGNYAVVVANAAGSVTSSAATLRLIAPAAYPPGSWTATVSPTAQNLWSVCYGAGQFVAVGEGGTILTSPDGLTWTKRVSGNSLWLVGVGFGNGLFVVVGDQGTILTSADGITWTTRRSGGTRINAVAYGNGIYLAVDEGGGSWSSTDGLTWTRRDTARLVQLRGLVFAQSVFVVTGASGTIQTTPDGVNFTDRATNTSIFLESVTHGRGLFVAIGGPGTTYTSSDAITWTARPNSSTYSHGVGFFENQFVGVDNNGSVNTSSDGGAWTSQSTGTSQILIAVAASESTAVVVGFGGTILGSAATPKAPAIVTQPLGQTITAGSAGTFAVVATGTAPAYQWRKNGTIISGATNATLTVASAAAADAGSYDVVVTNVAGSVTSAAATLTVIVPPAITTPPQNQSVNPGQGATFTVAASGTAPLSYQWRKDGAALSGATSATLSLSNVQSANAGSYTVVITNSAGTATSSAAMLALNAPPVITTQPADQTVGAGRNVTFQVAISGAAPFTYQWRKNGASISGATGDTLILPTVVTSAAGNYSVVVSNVFGSVTSSPVTLTVILGPAITVSPMDQSVAVGSDVALIVTATGAPPLTYQWSKDNQPIVGASSAILPLNKVSFADAGSYAVTVSNLAGAVKSNAATLVVIPAASWLSNLSVRTNAGAADETLIVGFIVGGGNGAKTVLIRGIGPSLAAFAVSGFVVDPKLRLFQGSVQIAMNDNWNDGTGGLLIAQAARSVAAFELGSGSSDAALLLTLQPAAYTAQVDAGVSAGVALVELYDTSSDSSVRLQNISARAVTGGGAGLLTAGFYVNGNTSKRLVLRGLGPTLLAFGVAGVLANPQITLIKSSSEVVAVNEDWWSDGKSNISAAMAAAFKAAGAFPLADGSRDAALVITLQPGSYQVQVSSADGTAGVALVEVYELP